MAASATIWCRCTPNIESPKTSSAPGGSWLIAAKARSISSAPLTSKASSVTRNAGAAAWVSVHWRGFVGLAGFKRTAICEAAGTTSFTNSSRLVTTPALKSDSPVILPPGRARLATSPTPTGSATLGHDDGESARRLFGSLGRRGIPHDEDIDLEMDEVCC